MSVFRLPDLGEGLQDAEIVEWHVHAGDRVVADQPLVSVETDKAVLEIPSPHSGQIASLLAEVGERVPVGAPLVDFDEGGRDDSGAVVGDIAAAKPPPAPTTPKAPTPAARGVRAVPAVRSLAHRLGVDLSAVTPTGPGGTISAADVEAAARKTIPEGWEPLASVRLAMARNMARSRDLVCPATVTEEADVEAWPELPDVTGRMIRAIVAASRAEPALNAWFDGETQARRLHETVDVALAIDSPDGLFAPVLRDAGAKDAAALRAEVDRLKQAVAQRTLALEAMRDATVTLSNFGTIGGLHAALAIMPPQVAIVGAGRILRRAREGDGGIVLRRVLPLSLTFDHRAVTGGEAARFLAALVADLAGPD